ncbi:MAG: DUF4912 domain-containing protein [Chthoniobacter sp.]|nr:DUF4912 domain-containing protein [Chthoniobacter sp.]
MPENNPDPTKSSASAAAKKNGAFQIAKEPVSASVEEVEVHKFEIGSETESTGPAAPAYEDLGQLPETYFEDTLFLVARDPRWLFSYWDFNWAKYPAADFRGGVKQFFLKVTTTAGADAALVEINPEARNWYVAVNSPDTAYFAEIGFFDKAGKWHMAVQSGVAVTPADALAAAGAADFATVPAHLTFERLLEMVKEKMLEGESLIEALARIAGEGRLEFRAGLPPTWNDDQKRLLAALLGDTLIDRLGLGSEEIDQLLRKQLQQKLHSESASGLSGALLETLGPTTTSLFSGIGASWSAQPFSVKRERGFYMHVNAEIIFYGGTHPDATVWVDGQEIKLAPDGTFRYHFTLPDGDFAIPIVAQSPDKVEKRSATLSFVRGTSRTGDVGATGQPSELKPLIGKK